MEEWGSACIEKKKAFGATAREGKGMLVWGTCSQFQGKRCSNALDMGSENISIRIYDKYSEKVFEQQPRKRLNIALKGNRTTTNQPAKWR